MVFFPLKLARLFLSESESERSEINNKKADNVAKRQAIVLKPIEKQYQW